MPGNGKWSVKKAVANVPEEGTYTLRVESVEPKVLKNQNKTYIFFKCVMVSNDDNDGKNANYMRFVEANTLWKLAADIANSNLLDMETAELPEDPEELAKELDDLMAGQTFLYECKHNEYKGETRADWTLVGPTSSL